ncbi:MAG: flavin reductase (DIM6/NTAB) family NADH-FMN oxidoreductase RutF [Saprospiraceae bacterium]|jgi:flavin reductase (DIM6/NTAB) family NADH-FMN oxidoreductase RutF
MSRDQFLEGMSHAACTVSVITTDGDHGKEGVTVSAMCSVSADPPSLLVCVHHQSRACEALRNNGVMCVNVLGDDQSHVSDTFAGRIPTEDGDHFSCAAWDTGETGAPMLENALVNFDCEIDEHFQFGSHYIFIGKTQGIRYREKGRALVYANRAYGKTVDLDNFISGADSSESDEANTLRVGCYSTLGPYFMPKLMAEFLQKQRVDFQLFEGSQPELINGLNEGRLDIALMYDFEESESFDCQLMQAVVPHVVLPAAHPLTELNEISLHDLAAEPMVLLDIAPSRDYFTQVFKDHGLTPNIAYWSPSFETVRGMVGNGLGYSLLASKPANSMSYDGSALTTRPLIETTTNGEIWLVSPKQERSAVVSDFAAFTQQWFSA